MGSKIHPPIVAVFGKNLAVLEVWDLVTLDFIDFIDIIRKGKQKCLDPYMSPQH